MDNLSIVKRKFRHDGVRKLLGIELDTLTETTITMHMQLRDDMNNLFSAPHGGIIYTFADAAFSVLGNNQNNISVAVQCSINYHASPAPGSMLYLEGRLVSGSRKIAHYLFSVYTLAHEHRTDIATMSGTLYRTGKHIEAPEGAPAQDKKPHN